MHSRQAAIFSAKMLWLSVSIFLYLFFQTFLVVSKTALPKLQVMIARFSASSAERSDYIDIIF